MKLLPARPRLKNNLSRLISAWKTWELLWSMFGKKWRLEKISEFASGKVTLCSSRTLILSRNGLTWSLILPSVRSRNTIMLVSLVSRSPSTISRKMAPLILLTILLGQRSQRSTPIFSISEFSAGKLETSQLLMRVVNQIPSFLSLTPIKSKRQRWSTIVWILSSSKVLKSLTKLTRRVSCHQWSLIVLTRMRLLLERLRIILHVQPLIFKMMIMSVHWMT